MLVDHYARDAERMSVLHAPGCKWLGAVGQYASLRHSTDERDALRWLQRNRGDEGDFWKRCRECGGRAAMRRADLNVPRYQGKDTVIFRTETTRVGRVSGVVGGEYTFKNMFMAPEWTPSRSVSPLDPPVPTRRSRAISSGQKVLMDGRVARSWPSPTTK